MKFKILLILSLAIYSHSFAQNDSIFNRLQAINNNSLVFYNIDGYTITSQTFNYPFTEKSLKKVYRKYSIKKDEKKVTDEQLPYNNKYVFKQDRITENLV